MQDQSNNQLNSDPTTNTEVSYNTGSDKNETEANLNSKQSKRSSNQDQIIGDKKANTVVEGTTITVAKDSSNSQKSDQSKLESDAIDQPPIKSDN